MNPQRYPLAWPLGWKRSKKPISLYVDRFFDSFFCMPDGCWQWKNTNQQRYSKARYIDDPGVAVYFKRKGQELCIACDKYLRVSDNLHAVGIAIEAFRTIERHGTGE